MTIGFSGSDPLPPGMVAPYPFASPPSGWLLLDGTTYNYDDYPALGALYGSTPGGTFAVHDYRDKVLGGVSATNALDSTAGADTADLSHTHSDGTLATDTVADHTHSMAHTHQVDPPNTTTTSSGSEAVGILGLFGTAAPENHTHDVDIAEFTSGASSAANTGSGGSHSHDVTGATGSALSATQEMRQATIYTNWIIKT